MWIWSNSDHANLPSINGSSCNSWRKEKTKIYLNFYTWNYNSLSCWSFSVRARIRFIELFAIDLWFYNYPWSCCWRPNILVSCRQVSSTSIVTVILWSNVLDFVCVHTSGSGMCCPRCHCKKRGQQAPTANRPKLPSSYIPTLLPHFLFSIFSHETLMNLWIGGKISYMPYLQSSNVTRHKINMKIKFNLAINPKK